MAPPVPDLALARLYRGIASHPDGGAPSPDGELGAALRGLFDDGRRAWPGVELAVEAFVSHLARLAKRDAGHDGGPPRTPGLPGTGRGPDLYVACACAQRVPGAIEAFDRAYLAHVDVHLARFRPTPQRVDEVRQAVRGRLFIGKGGALPRIAEYDGRGSLASWVRVVAIRVAVDLRRQHGGAVAPDERVDDAAAAGDPEHDLQQERYRRAFGEALRDAVAALESEQRRLLRRHFAEGVTLDALAVELGVHRATVARRLAAARAALRRDARRRLRAALGTTESEMESLAAAMRSQLDLSLPSLLKTA